MRVRHTLAALLVAASLVSAAPPPRRVYSVTWDSKSDASSEDRALTVQFDQHLRDELHRRGALVVDRGDPRAAIILRPRLDVTALGVQLEMIGVRSADQHLLGSVWVKATGSSRDAQLKAIATRACVEADRFE